MSAAHALPFLKETMILLTTAGIIVPLLQRLRIGPVLSYLLVGMLVGPFGLILLSAPGGWLDYVSITSTKEVAELAELGVVFLLFMIGLELSPRRLWSLRHQVLGLGFMQVLVSASVITLIAQAFGNSLSNALLLGACLSLSSTAIVMQILSERRLVATPMGRSSFAILLFQDLAVVPILVLVGVLTGDADGGVAAALGLALGKALLVVALISVLGYLFLRPLFRLASNAIGAEAFLAVALLSAVGTAAATGMAGLSMSLGAFLAGLLLAESEYSHAIETYLAPFKGLLLGLFFISVGMGLDIRQVWQVLPMVSASVIGLITIKAVIVYLLQRAFGMSQPEAMESGVLLGQAGEFGFVIVGMALTAGLLQADVAQFMLIVIGLSMMITPMLAALASKLAQRLSQRGDIQAHEVSAINHDLSGHVIIISFGRVGQLLARVLDSEQVPWLAIDSNASRVETARARHQPVHYGNALNVDMLRHLHPAQAQALVLALDEADVTAQVLKLIRAHWPALPVYVRARDVPHVTQLRTLGATDVVPDALESGLQLAGRVLSGLGVPDDDVGQRLSLIRHDLLGS